MRQAWSIERWPVCFRTRCRYARPLQERLDGLPQRMRTEARRCGPAPCRWDSAPGSAGAEIERALKAGPQIVAFQTLRLMISGAAQEKVTTCRIERHRVAAGLQIIDGSVARGP